MTANYTETDIKVLSEIDHIHQRPGMYLGNITETKFMLPIFSESFEVKEISFVPAVLKVFGEIVDNASDEIVQAKPKKPFIKITSNTESATYSVEDNGRGVPIGKHETGRFVPEVVFTSLRSGRNFVNGKQKGVQGTNGVGSSLTNIISDEFVVDIHRDNKHYNQIFRDSTRDITPPTIKKKASKVTGTKITFTLKEGIFPNIELPEELIRNRAMEIAASNPGVEVSYNSEKFLYKKGFAELLSKYFDSFSVFSDNDLEFYVVLNQHSNTEEVMFSWVNGSMLYDGGICNTQFTNAFIERVIKHLDREAKKRKITLHRNDIRNGLLIIGNIKVSDPQFDSQAKTKLIGPNLRRDIDRAVDKSWSVFSKSNKEWFETIIDRAVARSNSAATKKIMKEQSTGKLPKIEGFMEATSRNRSECQLLITEGNSAKANIVQSRDPKTTAAYPLTGKINNVYGSSVSELLKMGKVTELIQIIGLVPGKRALRSELRYGRVCFATDADYDGDHITTLLVNLFYQFWPELFDIKYPPYFYRMVAPNIVAEKGKKRIHFSNRESYEKVKNKYKTYEISYLKGLGTMIKRDWDMILNNETDVFLPILDDGTMADVLKLLFGADSNMRKEWLQNNP